MKFVVCDYIAQELIKLKIEPRNIIIVSTEDWYDFNAFKCRLDYIPHDVLNVAVHIEIDGQRLLYATDTSRIEDIQAKGYDYYLIEGNYKKDELEERKNEKIKNGEFVIEDRIVNSHLSYEQCLGFFMNNAKDSSVLEVMHQHKDR